MLKDINLKQVKEILLYTFVFGIVAHGYMYFNANLSDDSLTYIYANSSEHVVSIGRYFRPLYRLIRGDFTLPVLIGFLSLLFLGISIYFIVEILGINRKIYKILTCGVLVTNYSLTILNATYIHDADSYLFALLLVSLATWLSCKSNKISSLIISTILFVISLGIYQTYICVAVVIYLIKAFIELADKNDWKIVIKSLFIRMICILIAMIIYYIGFYIASQIVGFAISNDYNSISIIFKDISVSNLVTRLQNTMELFDSLILLPNIRYQMLIKIINILLLLLMVVLMIMYMMKTNTINRIIMLIILILLPLAMNLIFFIWEHIHEITIYPFFLIYVFILVLLNHNDTFVKYKTISGVVVIMISILIFNNCIYSNECYLKKELDSRSTASVFTRIIDRIEQTDGYIPGETKVAIIGNINNNNSITLKREGFNYSSYGLNNDYSVNEQNTYRKYINYMIGYNMKIVGGDEVDKLVNNEDIKKMPEFPAKDSVKMIDGILIVKLAN